MKPPPLRSSTQPRSLVGLAQTIRTTAPTSDGRESIVRLLYGMRAELDAAGRADRVEVADALRHWITQGVGPEDAGPVWSRAGALLARHPLDRVAAVECFKQALKCDRRELTALDRLAELLLKNGQRSQLEQLWREHMQALDANDATRAAEHERAWRRLARLRAGALNDPEGAIKAYEKALSHGETIDCLTELAEVRGRRAADSDRLAAADLYYRAGVLRLSEDDADYIYIHKALGLAPEHERARELSKSAPPTSAAGEAVADRGFLSRLVPSSRGSRRTALALAITACGAMAYVAYPMPLPDVVLSNSQESATQDVALAAAAPPREQDVAQAAPPTAVAKWQKTGPLGASSASKSEERPARAEARPDAKAPAAPSRSEQGSRGAEITVLHTKVRGGRIDDQGLREAMIRATRNLERCYAKVPAPSSAKQRGNVALSWVVRPNGQVQHVDPPSGSYRDKAVQNCAVRSVRATRFPRTRGGPAKVSGAFRIVPDR